MVTMSNFHLGFSLTMITNGPSVNYYFTVSRATQMSIKFVITHSLQKFFTTCFNQYGHNQVSKLLDEETDIFCFIA
jgi:hypothetical protein